MEKTALLKIGSEKVEVSFAFPYPEETWKIISVRDERGRFSPTAPWYEGAKLTSLWDALREYFAE